MKPTRQRLLDLLKNRNNQTAAELSRALGVTQADVRHHLSKMIDEGLIVQAGHQRVARRGRPARRYILAADALKDNFDLLSGALLTTTLADLSPELPRFLNPQARFCRPRIPREHVRVHSAHGQPSRLLRRVPQTYSRSRLHPDLHTTLNQRAEIPMRT